MRLVHLPLMIAAAALLAGTQASRAQSAYDYPWCALYADRSGAQSCYFTSREQCMATISGIGGSCIQSPYYRGAPRAERRVRRY